MSETEPIASAEQLSDLPRLPRDEGGPVFAEPWQAQAFALAVRLSAQGYFTWKEWAAALAEELKAAGMIVVRGTRCPLVVLYDDGKVFALDNRCPHLGFPLHRGSVEDGILTCHWHHARFDLASGCTFGARAAAVGQCQLFLGRR